MPDKPYLIAVTGDQFLKNPVIRKKMYAPDINHLRAILIKSYAKAFIKAYQPSSKAPEQYGRLLGSILIDPHLYAPIWNNPVTDNCTYVNKEGTLGRRL